MSERTVKALVAWYGAFQAVHVVVNVRALANLIRGGTSFPAMPPAGGWSEQAAHFFTAMASVDLVNAFLALVFVYGYFREKGWRTWLGTLTLTISVYAAMVFSYATIASGAWSTNLPGYLFLNISFFPVIVLFVQMCIWGMRGQRIS